MKLAKLNADIVLLQEVEKAISPSFPKLSATFLRFITPAKTWVGRAQLSALQSSRAFRSTTRRDPPSNYSGVWRLGNRSHRNKKVHHRLNPFIVTSLRLVARPQAPNSRP